MPKKGRPKKENAVRGRLQVRVDEDKLLLLKLYGEPHEIIRTLIDDYLSRLRSPEK